MKKEDFIYLIYKEYRGMLTAEEKDTLYYWLSAASENQKIKDDIILSMGLLNDYVPDFEVDLESDFLELQEKITEHPKLTITASTHKSEAKVFIMKRWIYAVVSVVLVVGALAILRQGGAAPIEMLTASTLSGETKELILEDGTKVWLNENSSLAYPSNFAKDSRSVTLKGEAYFEVEKKLDTHFNVRTSESMTSVLGTSFNIKELENQNSTRITVKSGRVKFAALESDSEVTLVAFEAASLSHDQDDVIKSKVKTLNSMAWQSNRLSFRDEPLKNVIDFLSKFFEVQIDVRNANIESCTIDLAKQPTDLNIILKNITKINKVEIESVDDNRYILTGGKC